MNYVLVLKYIKSFYKKDKGTCNMHFHNYNYNILINIVSYNSNDKNGK